MRARIACWSVGRRCRARACFWSLVGVWTLSLCPGAIATAPDEDAATVGDGGWIDLTAGGLDAWRRPTGAWLIAGDATLKGDNPRRLAPLPGAGVLINGPDGRTSNLLSRQEFGDIEAHVEFLIPRGSNSGVKFEGLYEVQIFDSYGVEAPKASDCGGIYPRAELLPKYHYLDDGFPPRVNAARPPGDWQTLEVVFRAPRFDAEGKKVASARFDRVVLNGQVIHENLDVPTPTGHAWTRPEVPRGPLLLQADHGPVAFRNLRVRPLGEPETDRPAADGG